MSHKFHVRILRGSHSQELIDILRTDIVPIYPPIPVNLPEGPSYLVDFRKLTREQRRSLENLLITDKNPLFRVIKKLIHQPGLRISTKDCVMRRVTQHQVSLLRESFRRTTPKSSKGDLKKDAVLESYWISMMIVTFFLGDRWRENNVAANLLKDERRMAYLRTRLENDRERYEHQFRFTLLADALFILQDSEGFDLIIDELQRVSPVNPEVKLEDIAIVLQIACMLVKSGHGVKFRPRTGLKGQDFDIEIKFRKNNIFAEIKCKRDETLVDVNNLRRTLYDAEKQLPSNNSSIVFVRIPTDWLKYEKLAPEVSKVISDYFQKVYHVNAVVFFWEDWFDFQGGLKISTIQVKVNLHHSPQYPVDNLNDLFLPLLPTQITSNPKGSLLEFSFGMFYD